MLCFHMNLFLFIYLFKPESIQSKKKKIFLFFVFYSDKPCSDKHSYLYARLARVYKKKKIIFNF